MANDHLERKFFFNSTFAPLDVYRFGAGAAFLGGAWSFWNGIQPSREMLIKLQNGKPIITVSNIDGLGRVPLNLKEAKLERILHRPTSFNWLGECRVFQFGERLFRPSSRFVTLSGVQSALLFGGVSIGFIGFCALCILGDEKLLKQKKIW